MLTPACAVHVVVVRVCMKTKGERMIKLHLLKLEDCLNFWDEEKIKSADMIQQQTLTIESAL